MFLRFLIKRFTKIDQRHITKMRPLGLDLDFPLARALEFLLCLTA